MTGVLFDLDGTLLNTLEDLTDAVNYALTVHGYPTRTIQEIRRFVGSGAAKLIALSVPEGVAYEPVLETYRTYYQAHSLDKTGPYPGILDALAEVRKQHPVAIVSNKPDPAVKLLCRQFFGDIYALGETSDIPRKPAPDMLYKAMAEIGVDRFVYVGDSDVDVITAHRAGAKCISVLWGFRDEPEIRAVGGEFFCHTPSELPAIIEKATLL